MTSNRTIKLAMELPTCRLAQWSPLADLDFILAHTVLDDWHYAQHFARRPAGREVILDNSYHELGFPLEVGDLREAAKRCNATYVISPDRVGDYAFTEDQFHRSHLAFRGTHHRLAVVMMGTPDSTVKERDDFLRAVHGAEMLCVSFKNPERFDWYFCSAWTYKFRRVHLLGCAELEELRNWAAAVRNIPTHSFSIDTGKALKWALRGKKLDELESVRSNAETTEKGLPSEAAQMILALTEEDLPPLVDAYFHHNVRVLQGCCK